MNFTVGVFTNRFTQVSEKVVILALT